MLRAIVFALAAALPAAHGQADPPPAGVAGPPGTSAEPRDVQPPRLSTLDEQLDAAAPRVTLAAGDPSRVTVTPLDEEIPEWPGRWRRPIVRNGGDAPIVVTRLDLFEDVRLPRPMPFLLPRALVRDVDGAWSAQPAAAGHVSRGLLAVAALGGGEATLFWFEPMGGIRDGWRADLEVRGGADGFLHVGAYLQHDGFTIFPGAERALPVLGVLESPDAVAALEWLHLAGRMPPAAELFELPADLDPAPLAGPVSHVRPLHLFAEPRSPEIWDWDAPEADTLGRPAHLFLVRERSGEPALAILRHAYLGMTARAARRLVERSPGDDGARDLGTVEGGFAVAVAPGATRRFRLEPLAGRDRVDAPAPSGSGGGWQALGVLHDRGAPRGTVVRAGAEGAGLAEVEGWFVPRPGSFLRAVVLHLAPDAPLALLPEDVERWTASRLAPLLGRAEAASPGEPRGSFAARAANLAWTLGLPLRATEGAPDARWLACTNAGFTAVPIEPALVEGVAAGRGFAYSIGPTLVLVLLDLDAGAASRVAESLADPEQARPVLRAVAEAFNAVRAAVPVAGLFADLKLERLRRDDFLPADRATLESWSAFLPIGLPESRTLEVRGGAMVREEVLELVQPLHLALDVRGSERIAVVIRHAPPPAAAPEATGAGAWLEVGGRPAAAPLAEARAAPPGSWREDAVIVDRDLLGPTGRVQLTITPHGGPLWLARLGFFAVPAARGRALSALEPLARTPAGAPLGHDRLPGGGIARLEDQAFLEGVGLLAGTQVRWPLAAGDRAFLCRAGLDAAAADGARAVLVVRVDGEERFASEPFGAGDAPQAVAVEVAGGEHLEIEVRDASPAAIGGGAPAVFLAGARLVD